jgi:hypothetical protein
VLPEERLVVVAYLIGEADISMVDFFSPASFFGFV